MRSDSPGSPAVPPPQLRPTCRSLGARRRLRLLTAVICIPAAVAATASCDGSSPGHRDAAGGPAHAWAGVSTLASSPVAGQPPAPPSTAVYTQRGSNSRVGWNYSEKTLNTHNVNVADFGRVVTYPVNGKVYAQPLFVPGLHIDGGVHNVVIVATQTDNVYAFDADATGPAPAPLWHTSFLVHGATPVNTTTILSCPYIVPTIGIINTPVIDGATDTMYLVAVTLQNSQMVDTLHAIDISTGRDRVPPVVIQASAHGTGMGASHGVLRFDAHKEQPHAALLYLSGVVYIAFASYCDRPPNHGWVLGYRGGDLRQVVVYNTTPNSYDGGIWQSATGMAADSTGNMFAMTANGGFDLGTGGHDASDTLVELRRAGGTLRLMDYFTPYYQACLNNGDQDFGSAGPLLLPHEVLAIGKEGAITVLNRASLGGYHTIPDPCHHMNDTHVDHAIQELPPQTVVGGVWGAETYWQGAHQAFVYTAGESDHIKAWRLVHGKLVSPPASFAAETLDYPGATLVGSSKGVNPQSAILWVTDQEKGTALRAYSATNLAHELYNSQENAARDGLPRNGYDNFCAATVADGRVFVGTSGELAVYGLLK
ncbi:MAG TPA: hypothetical protein VGS19_14700 [Streptosporangiaceae bacterium]|nr:hypothetical protein [Streptosporangiaceae bacterium]